MELERLKFPTHNPNPIFESKRLNHFVSFSHRILTGLICWMLSVSRNPTQLIAISMLGHSAVNTAPLRFLRFWFLRLMCKHCIFRNFKAITSTLQSIFWSRLGIPSKLTSSFAWFNLLLLLVLPEIGNTISQCLSKLVNEWGAEFTVNYLKGEAMKTTQIKKP